MNGSSRTIELSLMKFPHIAWVSCLAALLLSSCATSHDGGHAQSSNHPVQSQSGPTVSGSIGFGAQKSFR
jgi:hypothetical protein